MTGEWRSAAATRNCTGSLSYGVSCLGAFAVGIVWIAYTTGALPTPTTGTVPLWIFALFTFGTIALISIGVSTLAHILLSILQLVSGRDGQDGTRVREA